MNPLPELVRMSFKSLLHGRRLAVPVLLGAVPVLVALVLVMVRMRFTIPTLSTAALYRFLSTEYYLPFLILASIVFGTSAVADDAEDGSVLYLVVRPIRRGAIYLGKVAAAQLATMASLLLSLLATWAVLAVGGGRESAGFSALARDAAWLALGSVAYPAAFAAAAVLGRRPLQFAVGYFFLWEFPMAFAPTTLRFLTVSHYVLALMPNPSWWNSVVALLNLTSPALVALAGLVAVAVAFLVIGSIRFERREHLPSAAA